MPTIGRTNCPVGSSTHEVLSVLDQLRGAGRTIVVITHEDHVVAHAERRVEMRDGLVIADEPVVVHAS